MLFNSFTFILLFLPIVLVGFYLISRLGRSYGAAWLILASFTFYAIWNLRFVTLLVLSIAFNFGMGEAIHAAEARPTRQKLLLVLGVGCNLLVLFYYKYLFSLMGFAASFGITHLRLASIVLPLGISFFTFTQIGYLADMQQGVVNERGPLNYILFVTFFPHLIAGPILHNREIMPQFAKPDTYRFSIDNLTAGIVIFIIGLAKKCILADPIAAHVQAGFAATSHAPFFAAWFTIFSFNLQLYFDFSGYTDMAIGIARMFNVRFPINFNSPFKAASIIDFWHRWHMTLSRFLNLYLFNPIALAVIRSRSRRGKPVNRTAQKTPAGFFSMVAMPLLITMGLAGAWHGAGLQFLIFGLLHGIYLSCNHAWRMLHPAGVDHPSRLGTACSFLLTQGAVLVALVFFRTPDMSTGLQLLGGMFGMHGFDWPSLSSSMLTQADIYHMRGEPAALAYGKMLKATAQHVVGTAWFVLLCIIVWAAPNTSEIMARYDAATEVARQATPGWRPTFGWAAAMGAVGAIALLGVTGTTEFLYYQF